MRIIADSPGVDPDLKAQLGEIMRGQGNLHDLMHSDAFARLTTAAIPPALVRVAAMSTEEIERKAALGEAILESYRNQPSETALPGDPLPDTPTTPQLASRPQPSTSPVIAGTRKPNRDRVVTPEEDDEDDLYFRDRNQHGWLR
ncbi:hypothetical protein [Nocardia bovistercoris]|uniref:Uncharacterized protein n=1 Tax=Nocardia bovistercoris TaxID=2785916 RepID=A0A931N1D5_9NOCA|nr:hypothetical protein [Nocardia bovistercoris]MBH0775597.1 hypothetical protein [Nocardia bovistercoris]